MALPGSLISNKEGNYSPLLLATFQFADGSTLRASTHNLNAAEGGSQYAGNDYVARIDTQDIQQIQARSEQGIDRISDVTIRLFNADQFLLLNYELASGKGFKGAILQLAMILMDIDPSTGNYVFTNDSPAPFKFTGVCDAPSASPGGGLTLSIRATTAHNLARVDLPASHVQQRCINFFPSNASRRLAGATDMSSWEWGCGYDPDQTGTDPEIGGDCRRGNTTTAGAVDAYGNVIADGSGIFTVCNYTKTDCTARGMYSLDSSSRRTSRFTAIQWAPSWREGHSKSYVQGKNVAVWAQRNDSIYDRSYPLLYGTQWIKKPIIANIIGDGNSTRMEVVICYGDIGNSGIQMVLVNGVVIPAFGSGVDKLERWNFLDNIAGVATHTGGRNGYLNQDLGYDGLGDPYGSLATILIVVYAELAQSNSVPDVQILVNGPRLVKYARIASYSSGLITLPTGVANADIAGNPPFTVQVFGNSFAGANGTWGLSSWSGGPPGTITLTSAPAGSGTGGYVRYLSGGFYSKNPAWVVYDLLIWSNYSFAELDIDSFIDAAAYCDKPVSYFDLNGNSASHARFIAQLGMEDRSKANEILQSVLRSFNAQLVPNSDTGLLQLFVRQTLADQQPAPIAGSNYNTAISSLHADNTAGSGYVAYLIDESVFLQDDKGAPQVEGPIALPSAQAPNYITISFQDSDNLWVDDSLSMVDPDDVTRSAGYQLGGAQIPAGYQVRGISSFDQGSRVGNTILAENFRGNPQGDTRGTYQWTPTTTHRLEHLRVGHIVLFRFAAQSISPSTALQSPPGTPITGVLCRVEAIRPASNYERMTITLKWHEDKWYTDLFGQKGVPGYSDPRKSLPPRPPMPWKPFAEQPISGDSMWSTSEWNFAASQNYLTSADGSPIAQLSILGCPPVTQFSGVQPPLIGAQGSTANTGGTIPGGMLLYLAISVQDSSGNWSPLSKFCNITIPAATNTNTVTTATISWPSGVSAWTLFAGVGTNNLSEQSAGSGTPATITITALNVATYGPPDQLADSLIFELKREVHGGVFGDAVAAVASNGDGTGTITFSTACTTHQFQETSSTVGYDLSLIANPLADATNIPIADFHVIDNTGAVFHVSPDPIGIALSSVFVMRAFPSTITSTTIGDANFANAYNGGSGLTMNAEVGNRLRIIKGTGRGQQRGITANSATVFTVDKAWDVTPDVTSRFIVEEPVWQDSPPAKVSSSALTVSPVPVLGVLDISNFRQQTILVRVLVADQNGNLSIRRWSPLREVYLWGAQGTRLMTASGNILPTDGTVQFDTSGIAGTTDTLSAAITSTGATSISLTSGAATFNGTYIAIDSEFIYIASGGGSGSLTVQRGMLGTTAATHSNGATVHVPGALAATLPPVGSIPNQGYTFHKINPTSGAPSIADLAFVKILPGTTGGVMDELPDGAPYLILADNSAALGTQVLKAPGQ